MKKLWKVFSLIPIILLAATLCFIAVFAASYRFDAPSEGAVQAVTHVQYEIDTGVSGAIELPTTLESLEPNTAVTLTATFSADPGEMLLLKSVFAPMKVFINGELAWEYGQEGSYLPFLNDPPTILASLPLPNKGGEISLRIHYRSLSQRNELVLPAFYVGTTDALLKRQLVQDSFSFVFSLVLLFLGLVMIVVPLGFIRLIPSAASFSWLGLFYFAAGTWGCGECDLTVFLFPYPSLLYAMSYLGFFIIVIPLLRFTLLMVQPKSRLPLRVLLWVYRISVATALLLQLSGHADFTKSLYWFFILFPFTFLVFLFAILKDLRSSQRQTIRLLANGIVLLGSFAFLELVNYWLRLIPLLTLFFQLGVLGFLLLLTVVAGYFLRDSLQIAAEKDLLEFQMKAVNNQLALLRAQVKKIAETDASIRAQHHDLRHQFTVLRELNEQHDREKLEHYLGTLYERLPSGREPTLCENFAVNAVVSHYVDMARREGAEVSTSLVIPAELPSELECDLCVIIGNLMENAAEACARMTEGHRFVRVSSHLQHGILTIAVDNSFEEPLRKKGDVFLSSKREGEGVGLTSVLAVAKRHDGNAQFEGKDGVFQASAYVRLD